MPVRRPGEGVLETIGIKIKGYEAFRHMEDGEIYYRSEQDGTWCNAVFSSVPPSLELALQSLYREMHPDIPPAEIKTARPTCNRTDTGKSCSRKYPSLAEDMELRIENLIKIMEERYSDPAKSMATEGGKTRFLRWLERERPDFMEVYKTQSRASRTMTFYKDVKGAVKMFSIPKAA